MPASPRYGLLDEKVRIVPGWFRDILPKAATEIGPIAVLRLDGDSTSRRSTPSAPGTARLPGGFVIVDDDGGIEACRQAVGDYRTARGISADIHAVDWAAVWWRKAA